MLTTRQSNQLGERITNCGLPLASFDLKNSASQADIVHEATQSTFSIWCPKDEQLDLFSAEMIVRDGTWDFLASVTWAKILGGLGKWVNEVEYEVSTPNLWAELRQVPEILAEAQSADASNAPFTPDEQAEVASRLGGIKQLVRDQFELTSEQLAAIDQRLDEVTEELRQQGRRTWLWTFYGATMSTFMTDEIPPHVIQTIVNTVGHAIAHIFGIGGPPPVISS